MMLELKAQKEKWDQALGDRALTLDQVKEELIQRENAILASEEEVERQTALEHTQLQEEWLLLKDEKEKSEIELETLTESIEEEMKERKREVEIEKDLLQKERDQTMTDLNDIRLSLFQLGLCCFE